ncbi:proteasome inhibitor PI31 subunit-like [Uloborus diversus]|uniref:proteasome inhibitor PI31 subunit-like n=1 Tax=Uloborus diversus TaxID=327109 RepID=UPI00240A4811|nr:proteasome inhibitor PI31 subunit-like [Uloborus diversus]
MGRIRGLELQFNLIKDQLKCREDCIVVALHCILINEGLQCVGTGDIWPNQLKGSELLPSDWNANAEVYSLRYTDAAQENRYLLKVVKAGHSMHVNVALNETKSATMSVKVAQVVSDNFSDYSETYFELDPLVKNFKDSIMSQLNPKDNSPKRKIQTDGPVDPSPPPSMPNPDLRSRSSPGSFGPLSVGPPRIGGQDLDPFGRAEGGMLFDPSNFGIPARPSLSDFGRGGLPRGAVPPGSRFDPIGPPMPGGPRFNPNPDHYRPPDYDDYFM